MLMIAIANIKIVHKTTALGKQGASFCRHDYDKMSTTVKI